MTPDTDLATLKRLVDAEWRRWDDDHGPEEGVDAPREYDVAYKRVEAELARLREELAENNRIMEMRRVEGERILGELNEAIGELARLREGLRAIADSVETYLALRDEHSAEPEVLLTGLLTVVRALRADSEDGAA